MKPADDRVAIVTGVLAPTRSSAQCLQSWDQRALYRHRFVVAAERYGVVPAFAGGVADAYMADAEIIACLHDDLLIEQDGWDTLVLDWFDSHPQCLLVGFGGGKGLGAPDIYQTPYDPMQLARVDFVSNMRDAEAHGRRVTVPTRVACLDGFSQIGRADFLQESFAHLMKLGVVHHGYDSHLGVLAAKAGGEVWMLPVTCHHLGGQTAVRSAAYNHWAKAQNPEGDHGFWVAAHKALYEDARGLLPLRF